jgi:hypothetical protein
VRRFFFHGERGEETGGLIGNEGERKGGFRGWKRGKLIVNSRK